jgi:hypothetical protein
MSALGQTKKVLLLAPLVLVLGFSACASGEADGMDPDCVGSKCDEPLGPPTPHALAVEACDLGHDKALASASDDVGAQLSVWNEYHACLVSADNSTLSTLEAKLAEGDGIAWDRDAIFTVLEEFRYASLCADLEAISVFAGADLALVAARCSSTRERSLAHALSALVDYGGQRSTVFLGDQRDSFQECYRAHDALGAEAFPSDEYFQARVALVACAGNEVRGDASFVAQAYCALLGCPDELLITSFISAGFETAIDTSESACSLLVDASIYAGDDAFHQLLNCQLSIFGQLHAATLDGLQ